MPVLSEAAVITNLSEAIDELSTRLILDGVTTVSAEDFERFSEAARVMDAPAASALARRIATRIAAPASFTIPELTRILSSGLIDLRAALDNPEAENQEEVGGEVPSAEASVTAPAAKQEFTLVGDHDLILEFVTESGEHLVTIENRMLVLEKDNAAAEALNSVFRAFHTIKGLAGFLEFEAIRTLAHEVETLLDMARKGQLTVTGTVVDIVLECTDVVRHELAGISNNLEGKVPAASRVNEALLERVRNAAQGGIDLPADGTHPVVAAGSEVARLQAGVVIEPQRPERRVGDAASVRIDTAKLDQLMDMVREMVIAQTLIGHSPALTGLKDVRFLRDLTQLARITADVQRITTGMRMVPIGLQFQKTARLVRDLSRRAGKEILLETSGEDTELDKTIAEELSDPLLHMVRNSIDHGIESAEERRAAGKDPVARIRIAAYHQSGQIVVAISDDGRGLDREKILAKAQKNGLIQAGAQVSDSEIFQLIFEAGFSTAEKVTDISGRGVGMDVVRRHVQKLRGRIDIQSTPGEGTIFYLKLPLTLAIIEGLVVAVGDERYIVPIFSVKEMFRPTPDMLSTVNGKGEMAMVRGGLLPILRLHRRFEREPRTSTLTEGTLIVCESHGSQFCLFVDDLIGKQEVVIKGLGQSFKQVLGIAGCAILGDGRVGLILDVDGIYKGRA